MAAAPSSSELGRIWFPGSAWPMGHALSDFRWSGELVEAGWLKFDLHLETVPYASEFEPVCDEESDWRSPAVWTNYHSCTLSSTHWPGEGLQGLVAGSPDSPLEWGSLESREFVADPAAEGAELRDHVSPAFHIYLTGHDAVADHRVRFRSHGTFDVFSVEWTGRIALVYGGDDILRYSFRAAVPSARFHGFTVPASMSSMEAQRLFARCCLDARRFQLADTADGRVFRIEAR